MYLKDALKKCPQLSVVSGEDLSDARELGISVTSESVDADSKKEPVT